MSLNARRKLVEVAKVVCRELRRNETEAEKILWKAIRNKNLNGKKFYRQQPIFHDVTGRETFFVADFYCFTDKLIIELDGRYHQYRLEEDKHRTEILNLLGLRVIRFSNDEVINNLGFVLNEIKKSLSF